jgi:hypothetical protein
MCLTDKEGVVKHVAQFVIVVLFCFTFSFDIEAQQQAALSGSHTVSGALTGPAGPIADAEVFFTFYKDAECVRLAKNEMQLNSTEKGQYAECAQDLSPLKSDKEGRFKLSPDKTGWYRFMIRWGQSSLPEYKDPFMGDFFIEHYLYQSKYMVMAISDFFIFSGDKDMIWDFSWQTQKPQ